MLETAAVKNTFYRYVTKRKRDSYDDLPGPSALPFVGVGLEFQKQGCTYLTDLTKKYGRLVKFPLPGIRGVLVSDKDLVKIVLAQTERRFYKGKIYDMVRPIVGDGLVTNQGPSWRRNRLTLNPLFQEKAFVGLDGILDRQTERFMAKVEQSIAAGQTLDTTAAMMNLTFAVITELLFSDDGSSDYAALHQAFDTIQEYLGHTFWSPIHVPLSIPTARNRRLNAALRRLKDEVKRLIAARRKQATGADDLLSRILATPDSETEGALSEDYVFDEIITFLIAGHDTTALTLSYTLHLLATNPQYFATMPNDLPMTVNGGSSSWIRNGVLESMRLMPAAYMINRSNRETFEYKQYRFKPDTVFLLSQYAVHRDPEYWPEPNAFQPERFTGRALDDFSFFPFGGGPRLCIGNHLSMLETHGILARVLTKYRPVASVTDFKLLANLTAIPKPYLHLRWERC